MRTEPIILNFRLSKIQILNYSGAQYLEFNGHSSRRRDHAQLSRAPRSSSYSHFMPRACSKLHCDKWRTCNMQSASAGVVSIRQRSLALCSCHQITARVLRPDIHLHSGTRSSHGNENLGLPAELLSLQSATLLSRVYSLCYISHAKLPQPKHSAVVLMSTDLILKCWRCRHAAMFNFVPEFVLHAPRFPRVSARTAKPVNLIFCAAPCLR